MDRELIFENHQTIITLQWSVSIDDFSASSAATKKNMDVNSMAYQQSLSPNWRKRKWQNAQRSQSNAHWWALTTRFPTIDAYK